MSHPPALPHGPLVSLGHGVHVVQGTFRMGPGFFIARNMTIVESDDGLVLINSVRLGPDGEAALEALGPVRHVVKLTDAHGVDDPYTVERFGARLWAADGAATGDLRVDERFPATPIGTVRPVPGSRKREHVLHLERGPGVLVVSDCFQNHDGSPEGNSPLARVLSPLIGFRGGLVNAPMWRRISGFTEVAAREALAPVVDLPFGVLVTAHGPPVTKAAQRRVGEVLSALG